MRHADNLPAGTALLRQIGIGAGGQIEKLSQDDTGATKTCTADQSGGYVWGASDTCWRNMYDATAIPAGLIPANFRPTGGYSDSWGCPDAVVWAGSPSTIFMLFDGYLLKSTDTGHNFANTGATRAQYWANGHGNKSWPGHFITVDPGNVNAILIGSGNTLQYTTDGTTWGNITVTATNDPDGKTSPILTAVDRTSTVTGGIHQRWFYLRYGLTPPVQSNTSTATTGGSLAAGTYYYVVVALGNGTDSNVSNEKSQVTTGSTSTVTLSWAAVPGATGYKVYRGTAAGLENVYYSPGNVTTFTDTGAAATSGSPTAIQAPGVYKSETGLGASNFSLLGGTGAPVGGINSLYCDDFGTLWVTTYGVLNNVFKWTSAGGWVNVNIDSGKQFGRIAVDPNNASHIVAQAGGDVYFSTNGGTSWTHWDNDLNSSPPHQIHREATIKYLDVGPSKQYHPVANMLMFDRANSGRLWTAHGSDVAYTDSLIGTLGPQLKWIGVGNGIDELVGAGFCAIPGGKRISCHWDMGALEHTDINGVLRQTAKQICAYGPSEAWGTPPYMQPIIQQPCMEVDYACDNPDYVVFFQHGGWYPNAGSPIATPHISYSTDGAETVQLFPTTPLNKPATSIGGGSMAVARQNQIVIIWEMQNRAVSSQDGGTTWNYLNIAGSIDGDSGFGFVSNFYSLAYFTCRHVVTCDKTDGSLYLFNSGTGQSPNPLGFWKSTDGGLTWTHVRSSAPAGVTVTGGATQLKASGVNQQLFWTSGIDCTDQLQVTTDGCQNWTPVTTNGGLAVTCVNSIGFGKAAPGQTVPSMTFWGNVGTQQGFWRTDNNFGACILLATRIMNLIDVPAYISGDPDIYGRSWLVMGSRSVVVADYAFSETVH